MRLLAIFDYFVYNVPRMKNQGAGASWSSCVIIRNVFYTYVKERG